MPEDHPVEGRETAARPPGQAHQRGLLLAALVAERERLVAERDKLVAHKERLVAQHRIAADERGRRADERERRADERDRSADERDRRADERERRADDRAKVADARDLRGDEREGQLDAREASLERRLASAITPREAEVLALVVERYTNTEIAAMLGISKRTVESHLASLLHKFDAADRPQLKLLGQIHQARPHG